MNHTPGPWYRKNGKIFSEVTKDEINHLVDDVTYEANETLKTAAPELLEAILAMQELSERIPEPSEKEFTKVDNMIKAAIKKAIE